MTKAIYFDMDGTIADLYGVKNWLDFLLAEDTTPYSEAKPLINLNTLARLLNKLQHKGFKIGVISWTAKNGSKEYNKKVETAKLNWLNKHLKSVHFDEIYIVNYGTPKQTLGKGILFDDEEQNRKAWTGKAYDEKNILNVLKTY